MTRKQVAQRLGKSIATVRRLEGVLLHPTLDSVGKHHFDADEVEELAEGIQRGEVTLWQQMRGVSQPLKGIAMSNADPSECPNCNDREHESAQLKDTLNEQERRHRRELDALRDQLDQVRATHKAEQRELERELRRFVREAVRG